MDIQDILKDYNGKRCDLDLRLDRIKAWKEALEDPSTIVYLVEKSGHELGMPKGQFSIESPVEKELIQEENHKELAISLVKEWIKEEESRIFPLKLEVERIERVLNYIKTSEKFIIDCKYYEGMNWREIEANYNEKFMQKNNYITESGLKKIYKRILKKIKNKLEPFYPELK